MIDMNMAAINGESSMLVEHYVNRYYLYKLLEHAHIRVLTESSRSMRNDTVQYARRCSIAFIVLCNSHFAVGYNIRNVTMREAMQETIGVAVLES